MDIQSYPSNIIHMTHQLLPWFVPKPHLTGSALIPIVMTHNQDSESIFDTWWSGISLRHSHITYLSLLKRENYPQKLTRVLPIYFILNPHFLRVKTIFIDQHGSFQHVLFSLTFILGKFLRRHPTWDCSK